MFHDMSYFMNYFLRRVMSEKHLLERALVGYFSTPCFFSRFRNHGYSTACLAIFFGFYLIDVL